MAYPAHSAADDEIHLLEIVALVFAALLLLGTILLVAAPHRVVTSTDTPPAVSLVPDMAPPMALEL